MKPTHCCLLLALAALVLGACTPNQRSNRGGYYGPYGGRTSAVGELEARNWDVRSGNRGTTIHYRP